MKKCPKPMYDKTSKHEKGESKAYEKMEERLVKKEKAKKKKRK